MKITEQMYEKHRGYYIIYMVFEDGEKFKVWDDGLHFHCFGKWLGKIKKIKGENRKLIVETEEGEKEGYHFEAIKITH